MFDMPKLKLYLILPLLVIFIFAGGCSAQLGDVDNTSDIANITEIAEITVEETKIDFGVFEIFVFDIGKADAILMTSDNYTVMIDTGEYKHREIIEEYLLSRDISVIDYLIITHFHKDHVGGAGAIIQNFTVSEVIVPNYGKDSKHYERFAEAMAEKELEYNVLIETLELTLDGIQFIIYPPNQEYYYYGDETDDEEDEDNDGDDEDDENKSEDVPKENNFSLVVSVTHGNNNFLFAGDAKSKRLKELLSIGEILATRYDFLKVPHHGRYNKRSEEFIYMTKPEYAVITDSADNPADERVVAALEAVDAEIYFTSDGNFYCRSDGYSISIR